jgi:ribonucleotide monophosphatase NagD (HAD superfamily)
MIGDSLLTDIAGANAFGIDSVFITSGIHWKETITTQTFLKCNAFPTWVTAHCSWSSFPKRIPPDDEIKRLPRHGVSMNCGV